MDSAYSAAVVTFRRSESLAVVLNALLTQSQPPNLIVVADNDPAKSARNVVAAATNDDVEVIYVPVGSNLGPAGGWAAAVEAARQHVERGEWIGVFDDDDPLSHPEVMRTLLASATEAANDRDRIGAVGLRGARLAPGRMRLHRVSTAEGAVEPADYLASNGAPIYRWAAIEDVGFFDPELFFGFEDLDLGLRLKQSGWGTLALGCSLQEVADTAADRVPWREYYKTRALVAIARRHLPWLSAVSHIARSVVGGSVLLVARDRSPKLAWARLLGTIDGLRGQLGVRRYEPSSNVAKTISTG